MQDMWAIEFGLYGGSAGSSYSQVVNCGRSLVIAHTALTMHSGGGLASTGMVGYQDQPDENGPIEDHNFGPDWTFWPGVFSSDNVVSVTFVVTVGGEQEAWVLGVLTTW